VAKLTKISTIGPVHAALYKLAAAQITYDDKPVQNTISGLLDQLRDIYQKEEEFKHIPFNLQTYVSNAQNALSALQDPAFKQSALASFQQIINQAQQAIQNKTDDANNNIQTQIDHLISQTMEFGKKGEWSQIRTFYKLCNDLSTHVQMLLTNDVSTDQKVEDYRKSLEQQRAQTTQQAEELKAKIQQLISVSLPPNLNVNIQITPNLATDEYRSPVIYPAGFSLELDFGSENTMSPSMTLFYDEESKSYQVDDVLDFGDTDFFEGQGDAEFYFDLVNFIRTGKLPNQEPAKFVTLYRGMSNDEFMAWLSGQTIPKGKFFTSQRTNALAQDISGEFPELFTFKVRSDAIRQTTEDTYQLIKDSHMDQSKRITPI